jgi:tellurite resistance protein
MPNRNARRHLDIITVAYLDDREDELLDAVVTAAALVAQADNWIQQVEHAQLFDFLDRNPFLSISTRAEITEAFERRVRALRKPQGPAAALMRLKCLAGYKPAQLIIDVSEEVAIADCRLDPREQRVLELVRTALGAHPPPPAQGRHGSGAAR